MIFIFSWLVQVKVLTYLILLRGLIRDPGLKNSKSIHKIKTHEDRYKKKYDSFSLGQLIGGTELKDE